MSRFAVASLCLLFSLASHATEKPSPVASKKAAPAASANGSVLGHIYAEDDDNVAAAVAVDDEGAAPTVEVKNGDQVEKVTAGKTEAMLKAEKLVGEKLVGPLAMNEEKRSRFSRARMPAQQRRVRVLDAEAKTDKAGDAFLAFAIDARHGFMFDDSDGGDGWRADAITGCVYPKSGKVFVKMGDSFRPGDAMLGKKVKPVKTAVCEANTQVATR